MKFLRYVSFSHNLRDIAPLFFDIRYFAMVSLFISFDLSHPWNFFQKGFMCITFPELIFTFEMLTGPLYWLVIIYLYKHVPGVLAWNKTRKVWSLFGLWKQNNLTNDLCFLLIFLKNYLSTVQFSVLFVLWSFPLVTCVFFNIQDLFSFTFRKLFSLFWNNTSMWFVRFTTWGHLLSLIWTVSSVFHFYYLCFLFTLVSELLTIVIKKQNWSLFIH